jgi:hypothetical protein
MEPRPGAPHWLDRPRNVRLLWRGFLVVLALTLLIEPWAALHPVFAIEGWFGFHAWFGLLSCAAMIGLAKVLALLLKRPDTYYRRNDE